MRRLAFRIDANTTATRVHRLKDRSGVPSDPADRHPRKWPLHVNDSLFGIERVRRSATEHDDAMGRELRPE